MNYISMFSGIEAASVAFEPFGWKAVAYAETEKFPSAVLAHHYPNVPNLGDVKKVDWKKYAGKVDLVCGHSILVEREKRLDIDLLLRDINRKRRRKA